MEHRLPTVYLLQKDGRVPNAFAAAQAPLPFATDAFIRNLQSRERCQVQRSGFREWHRPYLDNKRRNGCGTECSAQHSAHIVQRKQRVRLRHDVRDDECVASRRRPLEHDTVTHAVSQQRSLGILQADRQ